MDERTVSAYGHMLAAYARIESMRAANMQRQALGESMAYGEDEFNVEAILIEDIARNL